MNLELLDPFRREIPDRVDATLTLREAFHGEKKKDDDDDDEWKAAYHVAFNRRGTYVAVGHASGAVAVHDFISRTLSAIYRPQVEATTSTTAPSEEKEAEEKQEEKAEEKEKEETSQKPPLYPNGVTSVTWSRRSRTLLVGAVGDHHVRLVDTTHPLGPEDCAITIDNQEGETSLTAQENISLLESPLFQNPKPKVEFCKYARPLQLTHVNNEGDEHAGTKAKEQYETALESFQKQESESALPKKYPILSFWFPRSVGGSLQIHPRHTTSGLAVLNDGSLVIFQVPEEAWETSESSSTTPEVKMVTLYKKHFITCAAFDSHGEKLYAASKDGVLLGFKVKKLFKNFAKVPDPSFVLNIPGGATAWHLLVSRNGRHLLLNCADSALRVYNAEECWKKKKNDIKPKVFQDVVSKSPFASCDFSGDAEYVVGGCNQPEGNTNYDLYLWNTNTGALMDRLTGPQVSLYSVAWHPTRSFLAVATSDGLVDLWGPRMDWTAFAPDFQALPMNVEYIEEEDEFDIVDETEEKVEEKEDEEVNVLKVEPVPVFASDSESESEVFYFATKVNNIMSRGKLGRHATDEKE